MGKKKNVTSVTEHLFDSEATSEVLSISLLYLRAVLVQVLACTRASGESVRESRF